MAKIDAKLVLCAAAVLTGSFAAGCASYAPGATTSDAGVSRGDTEPYPPEVGLVPADGSPMSISDAAVDAGPIARGENTDLACADFRDDDGNGLTDCADTMCGGISICCVGSTSEHCCAAPMALPAQLALGTCTAGTLAECAPALASFGAPTPTVTSTRADGGACTVGPVIAPQGSDRSDGGLVAATPIDTTTGTVAIESTLGVTLMATPATTLDGIAFGLTAQTDLAGMTLAHVRPVVGVVVSATDQTIRAVAGDISYPAHDLGPLMAGSGACSDLEVRIVTTPAGTFSVWTRLPGGASWVPLETARPYGRSTAARLVVYGRSTNPGVEGVHAWVRALSIDRTACDVMDPTRGTTGAFVTLPGAGGIRSVSRVGSIAVYERGGSIWVASVDGNGRLVPANRMGTNGDLLLAPSASDPFMESALRDPELVNLGDTRRLFFTGVSATGVRSIGYVDFDMDVMQPVNGSMPRRLIAPGDVGAVHVDGAAYFETQSPALEPMMMPVTHRWVVFRAVMAGGTRHELRAAELAGDDTLLGGVAESRDVTVPPAQFYTTASPLTADEAFYANRETDEAAFDHDEIAAPEVVAYGGVTRVFFAARRGARWSIGMLRSPDFAHFELAYPGPVLAGSGSGFDAVSVSDPDVWIDGAGRLTLYYTASDGTSTEPGLATQEVPTP
jgi:hypothetical protein